MLRSFVGKFQKGLSQIVPTRKPSLSYFNENQLETANVVPNDVRKGYFAVLAIKDGETKRFVVELDYLTSPEFLGLLDQAQEEYGFKQQGTLEVPCRPQELQKILDGWRTRSDSIKGVGRDIYFPKFL
ncbi:auxin-induced protein 6B [Cajanus cajan]|uniref:Auxin-induced protein 6B n=1 Tax=Cajanus cajan TaxID=3821 RepID=A0A151S2X6_CAJCA|nr:auxin-induced protein 6B [Cajanus cajan]KYP49152.1 Auxin-induced protein 6B [Cajanus cajan]